MADKIVIEGPNSRTSTVRFPDEKSEQEIQAELNAQREMEKNMRSEQVQ